VTLRWSGRLVRLPSSFCANPSGDATVLAEKPKFLPDLLSAEIWQL
jgi:hypothetical protein